MRKQLIQYLKTHPLCVRAFWKLMKRYLEAESLFIKTEPETMLFASFGGRCFDDSPRAIYEEICRRPEFDNWKLVWAFSNPDGFSLDRGEKVKIDTPDFFHQLLRSKIWVSNSGMTRGISFKKPDVLSVATWHGTPLKKICGDEHQNTVGGKRTKKGPLDADTIRCAQSEYDRDLFARLFHAEKSAFLLSDLPRNDRLLNYTEEEKRQIRSGLKISEGKKVILYLPTYREYQINEKHETFLAPPIDLNKWESALGEEYVLLIRAHYAVSAALNIQENAFVHDVSGYPLLNDLYAIADLMISDYSSAFFDFSILDKPMLCFAYDLEEYEEKRGLYLNLAETLPCPVDRDEDTLIEHIKQMNVEEYVEATKKFHQKFAPYAGHASKAVVDEIVHRLKSEHE